MTVNGNSQPDRIDELANLLVGFIDETRQFMAEQRQFNAKVTEDISRLTEQVGGLTQQVGWLTEQVGGLTQQVGWLTERVGGLTDDVGQLKGFDVRAVALQRTRSIARRLVGHQFWTDGYRDFNFRRASAVVKRQSTRILSWLRRSCHAATSRLRVV